MKIEQRKSISDSLKKYEYLSNDENDFIELTEWVNGEGFDISIDCNNNQKNFSISRGELDAINHLIGCLDYHRLDENS